MSSAYKWSNLSPFKNVNRNYPGSAPSVAYEPVGMTIEEWEGNRDDLSKSLSNLSNKPFPFLSDDPMKTPPNRQQRTLENIQRGPGKVLDFSPATNRALSDYDVSQTSASSSSLSSSSANPIYSARSFGVPGGGAGSNIRQSPEGLGLQQSLQPPTPPDYSNKYTTLTPEEISQLQYQLFEDQGGDPLGARPIRGDRETWDQGAPPPQDDFSTGQKAALGVAGTAATAASAYAAYKLIKHLLKKKKKKPSEEEQRPTIENPPDEPERPAELPIVPGTEVKPLNPVDEPIEPFKPPETPAGAVNNDPTKPPLSNPELEKQFQEDKEKDKTIEKTIADGVRSGTLEKIPIIPTEIQRIETVENMNLDEGTDENRINGGQGAKSDWVGPYSYPKGTLAADRQMKYMGDFGKNLEKPYSFWQTRYSEKGVPLKGTNRAYWRFNPRSTNWKRVYNYNYIRKNWKKGKGKSKYNYLYDHLKSLKK